KACTTGMNQSAVCMAGACTIYCVMGFEDCNGNPADGCEIESDHDIRNCGACGQVCGALPNATAGCRGGRCGIGSCNPGFGDCDQDRAGCEINLAQDFTNCGACNNLCKFPNAIAACVNGVCGLDTCRFGFANCDALPANGCEIAITSDV